MITLGREPAEAVPQRPVRRPMGPDRADVDRLAKSPARPQAHRPAGESRTARRIQRAPLREPHGIPWNYLPHDLPNYGTVYAYYAAWRDEGIFTQLNYDLVGLARVKEGRKPEPTASVIDTQSVKTSTNVPVTSQGTDAAKKIVGRKRGILTDTLGLLLTVTVTAASLSENTLGILLLDQAKKTYPTISKSWVGHRLQERRRRARGQPRNRCRIRQQKSRSSRLSCRQKALGSYGSCSWVCRCSSLLFSGLRGVGAGTGTAALIMTWCDATSERDGRFGHGGPRRPRDRVQGPVGLGGRLLRPL